MLIRVCPYNSWVMYTTRDVILAAINLSGGVDSVHGLVLVLFTAQYDITPWVGSGRLVRLVREYYYGGKPLVANDWYLWDSLPWSNEVDEAIDELVGSNLITIEHKGVGVDNIRPGSMTDVPSLPDPVVSRLANALGRYVAYTPWGFRQLVRWLLGLEDPDKAAYYNGVSVRKYLESMGTSVVGVELGP